MFNAGNLLNLLKARPFVPFRLLLSDGGSVEVRTPEVVVPGRQFAVVGLLDPKATDTLIDRWTTVWYLHVCRVEHMHAGAPPFSAPSGPAESTAPSPN
jgi:hypothetical protein